MKTFNEIMKIRDEPDNKPEVTKRKFQVKKINNEKMQAFGWASVAITENGETLEDWQGDIIEPDELESAAYKFVDGILLSVSLLPTGLAEMGNI